jgi:hypothetical protein
VTADRLAAEYVLPLRWHDDRELGELAAYLQQLSRWVDVTVVDGSASDLFAAHSRAWGENVQHCVPSPWPGANGKVKGVMTGLSRARHDIVIIADDDVRYDLATLTAVVAAMNVADLVRPQNYFAPLPWHARWDTARTLINRAFGSDYPGTLAVRRALLMAGGGYRGDVLFENLELIRTVKALGGRERRADDLFVARRPPRLSQFLGQRVRQAYDDFAQPARLIAELLLLPLALLSSGRPSRLLTMALIGCGVAEFGRRRAAGRAAFGPTSALWAPAWLAERAITVWLAFGARIVFGGVKYGDGRLRDSASSGRTLAARFAAGRPAPISQEVQT